jgi:prolyl 4-hydroxylase
MENGRCRPVHRETPFLSRYRTNSISVFKKISIAKFSKRVLKVSLFQPGVPMRIKSVFLFAQFFILSVYGEVAVNELSAKPRIYLLPNFLTDAECDHLIELSRRFLTQSTVVDDESPGVGKLDPRRSSRGYFLKEKDRSRMVRKIEQRISDVTGLPVANGEMLHILHYPKGAEYQPHYDWFNPATPGGAAAMNNRGGQRAASVIMYLNTPLAGGETVFPSARISIAPKKGDAVLFYNVLPSGEVDPLTLHGGAPVLAGEKWIATKWIRVGIFR